MPTNIQLLDAVSMQTDSIPNTNDTANRNIYKDPDRVNSWHSIIGGEKKWFSLIYKENNNPMGTYDENSGGWKIISAPSLNSSTPESWTYCNIVSNNETKSSIFPEKGFTPSPTLQGISGDYYDAYENLVENISQDNTVYMPGFDYLNPLSAVGNQIDVQWDELLGQLHCVHWNGVNMFYSRWNYDHSIDTFIQDNPFVSASGNALEYYLDKTINYDATEEVVHQMLNYPHMPLHYLVHSKVIFASKYYIPIHALIETDNEAELSVDERNWNYESYMYNCKIFLAHGRPFITYNHSFDDENHSGSSFLMQDSNMLFTAPGWTSQSQLQPRPEYYITDSFTQKELIDSNGAKTGEIYTLYKPFQENTGECHLWFNIVDTNSITNARNYETEEHIFEEAFYFQSDSQIEFYDDLQISFGLSPTLNQRYAMVTGTLIVAANANPVPYFNYGLMNNDNTIVWEFPILHVDANGEITNDEGEVVCNPALFDETGQGGVLTSYTKLISNLNANNFQILYTNSIGLHRKTIPISLLEDAEGHFNLFNEDIIDEHLTEGSDNSPNNIIQTLDYAPSSESYIPLFIQNKTNFNHLNIIHNEVVYAPGVASIFDLQIKEIRTSSLILEFSVPEEDWLQVNYVKLVYKLESVYLNDFFEDIHIDILKEEMEVELIDGRYICSYRLKGLLSGQAYYIAILPMLLTGQAHMSNTILALMPETSVPISSHMLTVPMNDANGAVYIGTGNNPADNSKFVGRLTHTQFGTNFNSISVENAECESPVGDTQLTGFTNMISLNRNLSPALKPYNLGFNKGNTVLFLIHKDTGRVLKTNQLGLNIDAIADCISDPGCVWIYEETTKNVHRIQIEPDSINTTYSVESKPIDYIPQFLSVNEIENRELWIEKFPAINNFSEPVSTRETDFAGQDGSTFKIANMVEVGGPTNASLILMADTEENYVRGGLTCFIKAYTKNPDSDKLWKWTDASFPWNTSFNTNLTEDELGDGDLPDYPYVRKRFDEEGVSSYYGSSIGLSDKAKGFVYNNDSETIVPNPKGVSATETTIESAHRWEIHSLSYNHGPHKNDSEGALPGFKPIPNTLVIHENVTNDPDDSWYGFYAQIDNAHYKHCYGAYDNEGIEGPLPNPTSNEIEEENEIKEYYSDNKTNLHPLVYIKVKASNQGWLNPYFHDSADPQTYSDTLNFDPDDCGNIANKYVGKDSSGDTDSKLNAVKSNSQFECLDHRNIGIYKSSYETSNDLALAINNACRTFSSLEQVSTNIITFSEVLANDLDVTTIVAESAEDYNKNMWDGLSINKPHSPQYAIMEMQRLNGISNVTPAAGTTIYGKIVIDFNAAAYGFFGTVTTSTTLTAGSLPTSDGNSHRNVSFTINNIKTPFLCGDTCIGNRFKIQFNEPDDATHLGSINHDTTAPAIATRAALGSTVALKLKDYTNTNQDSLAEALDRHDTYLFQDQILSDKFYTENTLVVNRRHFVDDGTGGNGIFGTPNSTQVRDSVYNAWADATAKNIRNRVGNPFIKLEKDGATKLEIQFLYPQGDDVNITYENSGTNQGPNTTGDSVPNTAADGTGPGQATITSTLPTQQAEYDNYALLQSAAYKNALISPSSDINYNTFANNAMPPNSSDEQYRIISRSGDIQYGKIDLNVNHIAGTPWKGQEQYFYGYGLAEGESITKTPGSLIIEAGVLGTYSTGRCVGNDAQDNNENACIADNPNNYFSRTGSSTFDPGKKYYYRMSYTFDGFQESPLGQTTWEYDMEKQSAAIIKDGLDTLKLTIKLKSVPKRATHITVWRKDGDDEALFRSVEQVSLSSGWVFNGVNYSREIIDPGKEGPSYEALTGLSSTMSSSTLNYSMSCIANNQLFVARARIKETGESYPNFLFRSIAGNFSIFNWAQDYCKLPNIPNAIASMTNKLFAWDDNKMYIIDPIQMFVRETFDGIGCLGKESVIISETGMFWFDKSNVYLLPRTGGIDYVGNKILTSEHGVGWQEHSPTYPYQAIFDPKRKAFGMVQLHPPNTDNNRYFLKEGNEELAAYTTSTESSNNDTLIKSLCKQINNVKFNFPSCEEEVIYDEISSNKLNLFASFKRIEILLMNKNYTKKYKTLKFKEFIAKNKHLNNLSKHFYDTKNLEIITLAIIVILKTQGKKRANG